MIFCVVRFLSKDNFAIPKVEKHPAIFVSDVTIPGFTTIEYTFSELLNNDVVVRCFIK